MNESNENPSYAYMEPSAREGFEKALVFICERVLSRPRGDSRRLTTKFIASRLVVIWKLLNNDAPSLRAYARELGVSPASLSKIGVSMAEGWGMRADWQRIELKEKYRRRAIGVAAGTWQCTDKREREKLRAKLTRKNSVSPLKTLGNGGR